MTPEEHMALQHEKARADYKYNLRTWCIFILSLMAGLALITVTLIIDQFNKLLNRY